MDGSVVAAVMFGLLWFLLVVWMIAGSAGASQVRLARIERRQTVIDRRLQVIMDHLGLAGPESTFPEVEAHLDRGNKIAAIKAYREVTGAGLKDAKDAVELMAMGRRP